MVQLLSLSPLYPDLTIDQLTATIDSEGFVDVLQPLKKPPVELSINLETTTSSFSSGTRESRTTTEVTRANLQLSATSLIYAAYSF